MGSAFAELSTMSDQPILVTGAAGFVGFHVATRLLAEGCAVVGVDSVNAYYDPALKQARLAELAKHPNFSFIRLDLANRAAAADLFARHRFAYVIHLAAQAGVRYSIDNPHAYVDANLQGFVNVLEGCRHNGCKHLVYASSSSVYGANTKVPFAVSDMTDRPISLYAASKKANELIAHSYSHLFDLPTTGLRFFTVYGPWGRPDMAYFIFTKAILDGTPIKLFNHGDMRRDFTFIDDLTLVISRLLQRIPTRTAQGAPTKVYNVGNHKPEQLLRLVEILESELGRPARRELLPMQPGDVMQTYADVEELMADVGFRPVTPLEKGLAAFVAWYRDFYKL
jgi:UDP-glucuronate 4-epimerase